MAVARVSDDGRSFEYYLLVSRRRDGKPTRISQRKAWQLMSQPPPVLRDPEEIIAEARKIMQKRRAEEELGKKTKKPRQSSSNNVGLKEKSELYSLDIPSTEDKRKEDTDSQDKQSQNKE